MPSHCLPCPSVSCSANILLYTLLFPSLTWHCLPLGLPCTTYPTHTRYTYLLPQDVQRAACGDRRQRWRTGEGQQGYHRARCSRCYAAAPCHRLLAHRATMPLCVLPCLQLHLSGRAPARLTKLLPRVRAALRLAWQEGRGAPFLPPPALLALPHYRRSAGRCGAPASTMLPAVCLRVLFMRLFSSCRARLSGDGGASALTTTVAAVDGSAGALPRCKMPPAFCSHPGTGRSPGDVLSAHYYAALPSCALSACTTFPVGEASDYCWLRLPADRAS